MIISNLYSSSLGLVEQEKQFDDSEQQAIFSHMPVNNCYLGQPEIPKPPPTHEQNMLSKQLTDFVVSEPAVAYSLPKLNYGQFTLTNQSVGNNVCFDDLDEISNGWAIGQYPQQPSIFIGCQFNNQQITCTNSNIGSSGVIVEQLQNSPATRIGPELVVHESGFQNNPLSQKDKVKITYKTPIDQINQYLDEHFNRPFNIKSLSSSNHFIQNLGNSLASTETLQHANFHQGEDPKPLITDSNQQYNLPQTFSSQKNKSIPEVMQPPIKTVEQTHMDLEELTRECNIQNNNRSESSNPLPATPVDELLSDTVAPNSEQPDNKLNCPYLGCDKVFKKSDPLQRYKRHIQIHTGVKNHICNEPGCGRAFSRSDHLLSHTRRHKGIKNYKCDYSGCRKAFVRSDELKRHMRTHTRQSPIYQAAGQAETKRVKNLLLPALVNLAPHYSTFQSNSRRSFHPQ